LFSYWFYNYVDPLIVIAYKKSTLTPEDLPAIRENEKALFLREDAFPVSYIIDVC